MQRRDLLMSHQDANHVALLENQAETTVEEAAVAAELKKNFILLFVQIAELIQRFLSCQRTTDQFTAAIVSKHVGNLYAYGIA